MAPIVDGAVFAEDTAEVDAIFEKLTPLVFAVVVGTVVVTIAGRSCATLDFRPCPLESVNSGYGEDSEVPESAASAKLAGDAGAVEEA